jgi:hypothetical protein
MSQKDWEAVGILAIVLVIALALIPPVWITVGCLVGFSSLLVFCGAKFNKSTTVQTAILWILGFVGSLLAALKSLQSLAEQVLAVKIAIAIALMVISFGFLVFLGVKFGIWLNHSLKNRGQSVNG